MEVIGTYGLCEIICGGKLPVEVNVVAVDGAVKRDGDHLRHLGGVDVAGHPGAIGRTEAVWQLALAQVAIWGPVGVLKEEWNTRNYFTYSTGLKFKGSECFVLKFALPPFSTSPLWSAIQG